jgi:glucose-6-phosphate 1-dehydrogenase
MPHDQHTTLSHATTVLAAPSRHPAPPGEDCCIVIFGAFGDLTKRLVMPALYNLCRTAMLPEHFAIIGVSRNEATTAEWAAHLRHMLDSFVGNANSEFNIGSIDEAVWSALTARMTYMPGDATDAGFLAELNVALKHTAVQHGTGENAIFYLAVADKLFGDVIDQLGASGLTHQSTGAKGTPARWRRVVIEKPFGHDFASARALDERIKRTLKEEQIFRIDHFLGKETVQSIMALRFANGLFEPLWNRDRIDHVQITAAETVGVEARGEFYEATGALRDMVPNHLFSLLAMVAMEPPVSFDAESVRNRKAEVFAAMPALTPENAVRAQYDLGTVLAKQVPGYRQESDVDAHSQTETFVALRVEIDNWRWAGVPFFLRTGKRMADRITEIAIRFKPAPLSAFAVTSVDTMRPNWLVIRIQPRSAISLEFSIKRPGPKVQLATVRMAFDYADWFAPEPNVGYETLIHDVIIGDATLFNRADMVESAWRVVQPVLDDWHADGGRPPLASYAAGSAGPAEAAALLANCGCHWRDLHAPGCPEPANESA